MDQFVRQVQPILRGPWGLVFLLIFVVVCIMVVRSGPKKG